MVNNQDVKIGGIDGGSAVVALTLDMSEGGKASFASTVTAVGSFIIGSADMSEADLEKLDGITNGTAAANKALVLDANKAIGTITHLTASNIKCDTLDVREINSISETALTLEVVDKTILAGLSGSSSDVNNGGFQVGESQGLPLREIFTGVEISPKFSPKINNFSASGAEASNTLDVFNDFKVGPLHTE